MKIIISLFGKPKDKNVLNIIEEYVKRISRYQKIEIEYLPIIQNAKNGDALNKVLDKFKNAKIFILDEDGKEYTSVKFANLYEKNLNESVQEILFAIGPSEGFGDLSDSIFLRKNNLEIIKLSTMTMQHDIAFIVLIEQIYRAVSIKNNLPYHKV
jgi:23S rRNA (pseudouridine1915-N3)-methyltransferase